MRDPFTAAVLAVFALAAILLPTTAPVAISDDWTYIRSVEYLINHWDLHILPVAAATQITQLFWGGLFGLLFGVTPGVLRFSTIVIVFVSACALRDMLRDLHVSNSRAAIAIALYLFNPIMFAITYSFMSDPHFVAWMTIAVWLYVKAGMQDRPNLLVLASCVAAVACLQRPHGAFIPLGVASWYLVSGRLRPNRESIRTVEAIGLIPAAVMLLIYTVFSDGLPSQQGLFLHEVREADFSETWLLIKRLGVIEIAYIGFFCLPIAIGACFAAWRGITALPGYALRVLLGASALTAVGITWFWTQGRFMPYIPHFLGRGGPGSGDVRYTRAPLFSPSIFQALTVACGITAIAVLILWLRSVSQRDRPGRSGIGLLVAILAWQAAGVVPQSFLFRNWIISLDRYLLPLLPLVAAIIVWSIDDVDFSNMLVWPAITLVALFSIIGTRDVLVFHDDVWEIARALNTAGVPNTRLDAGYAWDAYHLWEFSYENRLEPRTPDGSWWTSAYAQATDSMYVIAGAPLQGYEVLSVHHVSSWLNRDDVDLYVLKRVEAPPDGVAWPPE
jgi:hypothetical protein